MDQQDNVPTCNEAIPSRNQGSPLRRRGFSSLRHTSSPYRRGSPYRQGYPYRQSLPHYQYSPRRQHLQFHRPVSPVITQASSTVHDIPALRRQEKVPGDVTFVRHHLPRCALNETNNSSGLTISLVPAQPVIKQAQPEVREAHSSGVEYRPPAIRQVRLSMEQLRPPAYPLMEEVERSILHVQLPIMDNFIENLQNRSREQNAPPTTQADPQINEPSQPMAQAFSQMDQSTSSIGQDLAQVLPFSDDLAQIEIIPINQRQQNLDDIEFVHGLPLNPIVTTEYEQPSPLRRDTLTHHVPTTDPEPVAGPSRERRNDTNDIQGSILGIDLRECEQNYADWSNVHSGPEYNTRARRAPNQTSGFTTIDFGFDWIIEKDGYEQEITRCTAVNNLQLVWSFRITLSSDKSGVYLMANLMNIYPNDLLVRATLACIKYYKYNKVVMHFEHAMNERCPTRKNVLLRRLMKPDEPLDFDMIRVAVRVQRKINKYVDKDLGYDVGKLIEDDKNPKFCDTIFLISGKLINRHKPIIAARSSYFDKLFIDYAYVDIHVFAEDSEIFIEMLNFMYSGQVDLTNRAHEMRRMAAKYQVWDLVAICDETILKLSHGIELYQLKD